MEKELTLEERINKEGLRPWSRLPFPKPCDLDVGPAYFYTNFIQPLVTDMIKLMCVGLHIDDEATESLRSTIDEVLSNVDALLLRNPIIQKYQAQRAIAAQKLHVTKSTESIRTVDYYIRDYDEKQLLHRTWVVNTYLISKGLKEDTKDSWKVNDLKKYNVYKTDVFIETLIDKSVSSSSSQLKAGMQALAKYKMDLWNRPRWDRSKETASLEPFNPGSATQLQELFKMLNIEPMEVSAKTGNASWGRKHIEILLSMSNNTNKEYEEILQCIIDHSFSGIIRSTFLKAFDTYTIDGVLHGNIKLLGAKTARPTSNSPNLNDTEINDFKTSLDDNKQMIEWCFQDYVILALQGFIRVILCLKYPKRGNSLIRNVTQCTIVHTQTFQRTIPC
jgi:hypothetical protein